MGQQMSAPCVPFTDPDQSAVGSIWPTLRYHVGITTVSRLHGGRGWAVGARRCDSIVNRKLPRSEKMSENSKATGEASKGAATRGAAKTTDRLRQEIDAGKAGDKQGFPDPAAAPLGTDAEAGGAPPTEAERRARPGQPPPRQIGAGGRAGALGDLGAGGGDVRGGTPKRRIPAEMSIQILDREHWHGLQNLQISDTYSVRNCKLI